MVRDHELLVEFNKEQIRSDRTDYFQALKLFEEMWKEGLLLGVPPVKDPLEGIEVDIRIARILNDV
jgi:hypothetical protein